MLNTPIAFPPFDEQKFIVEKVNALMALCDKLEQVIKTHQTTQEQWMQGCLREVLEAKTLDGLYLNIAEVPIARYVGVVTYSLSSIRGLHPRLLLFRPFRPAVAERGIKSLKGH